MSRLASVLYVEDDPNDAFLVEMAFRKARLPLQMRHLADGQEALDYLSGSAAFSDRSRYPLPELVLLDLKLPRMDGFEVLSWARSRGDLRRLPIFVLSSSDLPDDIAKARKLGATDYFVKSADFSDLVESVLKMVDEPAEEQTDGGAAPAHQ